MLYFATWTYASGRLPCSNAAVSQLARPVSRCVASSLHRVACHAHSFRAHRPSVHASEGSGASTSASFVRPVSIRTLCASAAFECPLSSFVCVVNPSSGSTAFVSQFPNSLASSSAISQLRALRAPRSFG
ncbi:hypothetical protein PI125_g5651 [Phytophthora idaei]|nr:hypothetical protein PI125_g5651 [Phytophthora idaei]